MEFPQHRRFEIEHGVEQEMFLRSLPAEEPLGTLLYIHGLGESGLCFEGSMTHPSLRRWHSLVPDLLGYGKSAWTPEPLSVAGHAERLEELLRVRGSEPVVVIGHSMGGVIGTLLCERAPERVRAFVNVEGNISLGDCGFSSRAARFSPAEWLDHGADQVLDEILALETETKKVVRAYAASIGMCDPRVFHRNSDDLVELSACRELASRLAALEPPSLFVYGSPRGLCGRSLDLLEREDVPAVGIPDTGHWPFLDAPDLFARELAGFLATLQEEGR